MRLWCSLARRLMPVAFAVVTLAAPRATFAAQTPASDWTAFRLNPELNPVVALDGPPISWTFKTAGGISSSPTISGDTVFVGGNDHHVYALDLRTGALRWNYTAADDVMTAPLVYHGTVVVGEGNNHADETMFFPPHFMLMGDGSNAIIGLDAKTGKQMWKRRVPGTAMPTGAIVGDTYIEHDAAGMLFAFGIADGSFRWREYVGSVAAMVAANRYAENRVVSAGDYPNAVFAFDGRTGAMLWRTPFPDHDGGFDDCPLASDGHAIFATYNAHPDDSKYNFVGYTTPAIQHVYALDGETGTVRWNTALDRGILPVNNSTAIPMLYDGAVYVGSAMTPAMYAIDAQTGAVLWHLAVEGPVKGGVVAKDGVVYFGDLAGYFWAVDAKTGAVAGKTKEVDGFNVGSPIIVGSSIIDGTAHGYVLAMPIASLLTEKKPAP